MVKDELERNCKEEAVMYQRGVVGTDSAVGIATRQGLDGPGIDSR
jgi:hypothetical protein